MVRFNRRILIIGCGGVSQCSLQLLLKLVDVLPQSVTVIDLSDQSSKIHDAIIQGVQFRQHEITRENYADILKLYLSNGDILIDLACNIKTVALVDWCYYHGVRFVNTTVEIWEPFEKVSDPKKLTLYHRQIELTQLQETWKNKKGPTAIVDHGANPGLVSHFVKQGLIDIAQRLLADWDDDDSLERKNLLQTLLNNRDYANLAYHLGVKTIHIAERDSQITDQSKEIDEFVNTWSITGGLFTFYATE
ncbi:unnamed protein product [Didymodactylos carnosus]|uniref:Saccharopine dehydrogenase NADP binding domain-containing protein n=1 Tax=Didymodactylos carnosus TaxID=1234261 RepID=A0A814AZ08_9BILA|nr:unnamed protein product [Didymodactylos carnosus]CAF0920480.1 unnamed protein product [Didymodactylos carnosus]CAF3569772.1 unnamed protein product [Didymodactylos carnosus]CAF3699930.1 unnamed protein product [Didymodactylos carnosus]